MSERLQNGFTSLLGLPLYENFGSLFVLVIFIYFLVQYFSNKKINLFQDFSHLFLGLFFSLGFPGIFDFFFSTVSFLNNDLYLNALYTKEASLETLKQSALELTSSTIFTLEGIPQANFSLFFDENLISFALAFFLLGGSEQEDDEDFILEQEEADFIDDIVASLFIANLGKDIEGNGELLVKVSSIFSFVLMNNLMGMLPYSDTGTSSLMLTFWVALSIFVSLLTIMIRKNGVAFFFSLFMPAGCPLPLMFLLIPIEFVSYSFRLVSLSVRLFANMMAGHTLLKVIVGFSFSMILMGDSMVIVNLFPIALLFILTFLEVGVALIQAYIFTILTCIYLKDIFVGH
jgi:F-type H+-transporting ATPase subunit a